MLGSGDTVLPKTVSSVSYSGLNTLIGERDGNYLHKRSFHTVVSGVKEEWWPMKHAQNDA